MKDTCPLTDSRMSFSQHHLGSSGTGRVCCVTQSVRDISAMKITAFSQAQAQQGPILGFLRNLFKRDSFQVVRVQHSAPLSPTSVSAVGL